MSEDIFTWKQIILYLKQIDGLHRFYFSEGGWCYLTNKHMQRIRITSSMDFEVIKHKVHNLLYQEELL